MGLRPGADVELAASMILAVRGGVPAPSGQLLVWLLAALLALCGLGARAQDLQPVPALSGRVIDQTGTLDSVQQASLTAKLASIETQTGSQVVVLLVPTTLPEDIAAYGQRVADSWKIGRRNIGDGLLIVVAKNDRRVRIEVAKTLEGAIPDLTAKRVIDGQITPAFRAGDYAGGLNAAVDQLAARIRGEALPEPAPRDQGGGSDPYKDAFALLFFAVLFIGPFFVRLFGRRVGPLAAAAAGGSLGWWLTASATVSFAVGVAALLYVAMIGMGKAKQGWSSGGVSDGWVGGGGGFGSGGGGGGGGFSSGGGGDFGGGGASGNW